MSESCFKINDKLKLSNNMSNETMNHHDGVQCDVCGQNNFRGTRYKCLICPDFDMCPECFHRSISPGNHQATHPMQCILSQTEVEFYFRGEDLFLCFQKLQSLSCPYCGLMGLTVKTLMKHLIYKHQRLDGVASTVLCPICASRTCGNCNYTTNDLPAHLVVEHHVAGPASLVSRITENTVASLRNPNSDPTPTPTPAPQRQMNSRPLNRNSIDSAFLELMSHLPDVRFDTRGPNRGNSTNAQALQQIQFQLNQQQIVNRPLRRGGFNIPIPPESVNQRDRAPPSLLGTLNGSRRASAGGRTRETALALQAALATETRRYCMNLNAYRHAASRAGNTEPTEPATSTNCVECKKTNNDHVTYAVKKTEGPHKFLLNKLLRSNVNGTNLAKCDRQRADRSLFAQALVLSAFGTSFEVETETQNGPSKAAASFETSIQIDEKKPKKKKYRNTSKRLRAGINVAANTGKESNA